MYFVRIGVLYILPIVLSGNVILRQTEQGTDMIYILITLCMQALDI